MFFIYNKQYRDLVNAEASFVSRVPFTHFLTLSFARKDSCNQSLAGWPTYAIESEYKKRIAIFFLRMDRHVFTRIGCKTKQISYYAIFENQTRARNPTHLHAHVSLFLEEHEERDFARHWERDWSKLNFSATVLQNSKLEKIREIKRVARYMVKQNDFSPLIRLSPAHEAICREKGCPSGGVGRIGGINTVWTVNSDRPPSDREDPSDPEDDGGTHT